MKKFLFAAFSLLLAAGLFAFTAIDSKTEKKPDQEYFWYVVTYDGNGDPMIEYQAPLNHISVAAADLLGYDCPGDTRVCKAGFVTELEFNDYEPITTDTEGDVRYKEALPN